MREKEREEDGAKRGTERGEREKKGRAAKTRVKREANRRTKTTKGVWTGGSNSETKRSRSKRTTETLKPVGGEAESWSGA